MLHYDIRLLICRGRGVCRFRLSPPVYSVIRMLVELRYEVAGLAACRVSVRGKEAMHLGVLHRVISHGVVVSKPWRSCNEHDCFRRAMDAQSDRVAGYGTAQGSSSRGGLRGLA